jgi:hypothetical protein
LGAVLIEGSDDGSASWRARRSAAVESLPIIKSVSLQSLPPGESALADSGLDRD